ncbi:uncharacterized protein LOC134286790 [Aedes albopictus]|uniref:Uncharacterized protein n=1 Tax=Aedes albopictus TaxID=7160 RepID=A0ABM1ZNW5_AEDAL
MRTTVPNGATAPQLIQQSDVKANGSPPEQQQQQSEQFPPFPPGYKGNGATAPRLIRESDGKANGSPPEQQQQQQSEHSPPLHQGIKGKVQPHHGSFVSRTARRTGRLLSSSSSSNPSIPSLSTRSDGKANGSPPEQQQQQQSEHSLPLHQGIKGKVQPHHGSFVSRTARRTGRLLSSSSSSNPSIPSLSTRSDGKANGSPPEQQQQQQSEHSLPLHQGIKGKVQPHHGSFVSRTARRTGRLLSSSSSSLSLPLTL